MEEFVQRYYKQAAPFVNRYLEVLRTASEKYDIAPLPAELVHIDPKDTYQFYFKDTIRAFLPNWNPGTGVTAEQDPQAQVSRVMKVNYDKTIEWYSTRMYVTDRDVPGAKMLDIYVRQDETVTIPPKAIPGRLETGWLSPVPYWQSKRYTQYCGYPTVCS